MTVAVVAAGVGCKVDCEVVGWNWSRVVAAGVVELDFGGLIACAVAGRIGSGLPMLRFVSWVWVESGQCIPVLALRVCFTSQLLGNYIRYLLVYLRRQRIWIVATVVCHCKNVWSLPKLSRYFFIYKYQATHKDLV